MKIVQYVRTVNTYVLNTELNKLVMLKHKKLNLWMPPGGKLQPNELTHIGAKREVHEETGLDIEFLYLTKKVLEDCENRVSIVPTPIFAQLEGLGPQRGEDFIYLAVAKNDEILNLENHEIGWFTFEEVKRLDTFDNVKRHIEYIEENLEKYL